MQNKQDNIYKKIKTYNNILSIWKLEIEPGHPNQLYTLISTVSNEQHINHLNAEQYYEYWRDHIDDDYKHLLDFQVNHLSENSYSDITEIIYPWITPTGEKVLIRSGGRLYKKILNKTIVIGYNQKVESIPNINSIYQAKYRINIINNTSKLLSTNLAAEHVKIDEVTNFNGLTDLTSLDCYDATEQSKLLRWFELYNLSQRINLYSTSSIVYKKRFNDAYKFTEIKIQPVTIEDNSLVEFDLLFTDIDDTIRKDQRILFLTNLLNYIEEIEGAKFTTNTLNDILIRDFHTALANEEFEVYYQPKYNYKDNKIIGAEALIRWNYNKEFLLPPDLFIPLFENNNFILKLDQYTWRKSCEYINKYNLDIIISVNVSMKHLHDPQFQTNIEQLIKTYNINPNKLCLEFTETACYNDMNNLNKILTNLHNSGVIISLDDFGSGYSNLSLLKDIPIDEIKIDRSLVTEVHHNEKATLILESIYEMSHKLNLDTIVEGVETNDELSTLSDLGFRTVQGYLFSKPLPVGEFISLLNKPDITC